MTNTAPATTHAPLTQGEAIALGELLTAVRAGKKVTYSLDGGDTIFQGVLRHVVVSPTNFAFLLNDGDVRDGFVRITGISGPSESALAIPAILDLIREGLFAVSA